MTSRRFSTLRQLAFIVFAGVASSSLFAQFLLAQGPVPDAPVPAAVALVSSSLVARTDLSAPHKFWDTENCFLFAAAAASNGADFAVTHANLQSGGHELNPIVRVFGRSSAGLAVNFVGETAGVMGVSYFLHRAGHHRLERAASVVNFGSSVGAVTYGLTHRNVTSNSAETRLVRQSGFLSVKIKIGSR